MYWMQFLSNPIRSLLGVAGIIVAAIVLLLAIGHSPHGVAFLGGILAIIPVLVMIRIPMRFIVRFAVGAFVIVGVVSLVGELIASGVLSLLLLGAGVLVLVSALRWARLTRQGFHPPRGRRPSSKRKGVAR
jgi:hypothetical protein